MFFAVSSYTTLYLALCSSHTGLLVSLLGLVIHVCSSLYLKTLIKNKSLALRRFFCGKCGHPRKKNLLNQAGPERVPRWLNILYEMLLSRTRTSFRLLNALFTHPESHVGQYPECQDFSRCLIQHKSRLQLVPICLSRNIHWALSVGLFMIRLV